MIEAMKTMRTMMLTMHSTMSGIFDQMDEMSENATAMGRRSTRAKNDDSFYLPPEVFENEDFKRAMKLFLSPDGQGDAIHHLAQGRPAIARGHRAGQCDTRRPRRRSRGRHWRTPRSIWPALRRHTRTFRDGSK